MAFVLVSYLISEKLDHMMYALDVLQKLENAFLRAIISKFSGRQRVDPPKNAHLCQLLAPQSKTCSTVPLILLMRARAVNKNECCVTVIASCWQSHLIWLGLGSPNIIAFQWLCRLLLLVFFRPCSHNAWQGSVILLWKVSQPWVAYLWASFLLWV